FSKYLLTLLLVAIGGIASSIYGYLMLFILKESITSEFLLGCLTSISIGLTSFFILLPIVFQFGVEKARYIMFLLFMIPFASCNGTLWIFRANFSGQNKRYCFF
ncbi:MAG: ABC-2 transporter permease, partial [Acetivibrio ethanolgignens]